MAIFYSTLQKKYIFNADIISAEIVIISDHLLFINTMVCDAVNDLSWRVTGHGLLELALPWNILMKNTKWESDTDSKISSAHLENYGNDSELRTLSEAQN